jgi:hypothetical protein
MVTVLVVAVGVFAGGWSIGWIIREDLRARAKLREVERWLAEQDKRRGRDK